MLLQLFLVVLCSHKDKLVLDCVNDILINFLSRNKF